jgi:hypothetical protein
MISSLLLRVSTVLLLAGLLFGIYMGMHEDFTLAPAHAHLILIGFVLMFLVGLYYRIVPEAGSGLLAKIQAGLHIIGAIALPIGVVQVLLGSGQVLVIVGSLVVLAAMAVFTYIVFRTAAA